MQKTETSVLLCSNDIHTFSYCNYDINIHSEFKLSLTGFDGLNFGRWLSCAASEGAGVLDSLGLGRLRQGRFRYKQV